MIEIPSRIETHPDYRNLLRVITQLSLISHAPSQTYNLAPPPEDLKRPPRWRTRNTNDPVPHMGAHGSQHADTQIPKGGIDWFGDVRSVEYRQKSHVFFIRRLERIRYDELPRLLKQAEQALEDWRKTPLLEGARPALRDPRWKQWVADSTEDAGTVARLSGCSRQYVHKIRKMYRQDEAA